LLTVERRGLETRFGLLGGEAEPGETDLQCMARCASSGAALSAATIARIADGRGVLGGAKVEAGGCWACKHDLVVAADAGGCGTATDRAKRVELVPEESLRDARWRNERMHQAPAALCARLVACGASQSEPEPAEEPAGEPPAEPILWPSGKRRCRRRCVHCGGGAEGPVSGAQAARLFGELADAKARLPPLQRQVCELKAQLAELRSPAHPLQRQVDDLKTQLAAERAACERRQAQVEALGKEAGGLRAALSAAQLALLRGSSGDTDAALRRLATDGAARRCLLKAVHTDRLPQNLHHAAAVVRKHVP
jgi:hypothetical protein